MSVSRRSLLKGISLSSVLSALPSFVYAAPKRSPGPYERLGIRPVINFLGTMTTLGASKMWEDLHEAAGQASREYVVLEELKNEVGKRISALIGCEDALVTSGAAGAICLGTCASLTGSDTQKVRQLPDLTGMKKEVIIQKVHRNGYDHAVRNTGVRIVEVESERALIDAIGDQTAMMYFLGGTSGDWRWETPVSLERCREITRPRGRAADGGRREHAAALGEPPPAGERPRGSHLHQRRQAHARPAVLGDPGGAARLGSGRLVELEPPLRFAGATDEGGAGRDGDGLADRREVLAAGLRGHRSPVRQAGRVPGAGAVGRARPEGGALAGGPDAQHPPRDGAVGRTGPEDHGDEMSSAC